MKRFIFFNLLLLFCSFARSDILETGKLWINFVSNQIYDTYCDLNECCSESKVPYDAGSLKLMLSTKLFGQHIASEIVLNAVNSHLKKLNHRKPLVLSFHGSNGVGKTYVSRLIAKALYEKGEGSKFYHFYYGLEDFPFKGKVPEYQAQLKYEIESAINRCEKSLFVFDGVDQMPPGLLNALMPIIDCPNCGIKNKKNKSIFIFLTNAGGIAIENQLLKKIKEGTERESTTLQDFEKIIVSETFNRTGGLYESLMIKSEAIDFYIPFLPLEKKHVKNCIIESMEELNLNQYFPTLSSTEKFIEHVFNELLFGPEPENYFSLSGCKRVAQIVARISIKLNPDLDFFYKGDIKKKNFKDL